MWVYGALFTAGEDVQQAYFALIVRIGMQEMILLWGLNGEDSCEMPLYSVKNEDFVWFDRLLVFILSHKAH